MDMITFIIIVIVIIHIIFSICDMFYSHGIEYPSYDFVVDGHRLRVSKILDETHHKDPPRTDCTYVEMNGIRYHININIFAIINFYEPITISQPLHDALTAAGIANKPTIRKIENLLEQSYSDRINPRQWLWDIIEELRQKMHARYLDR